MSALSWSPVPRPVLALSPGAGGGGKDGRKRVRLNFWEDFMLSGTAAVISKTAAAPIERVKMVLQNQDEMIKKKVLDRRFTGMADCFQWLIKNEGVIGLWKSNGTNCLRYFPTQALNMGFKEGLKKNVPQLYPNKDDAKAMKLAKNVVSGGLAGGGSLCFVYNLDYARTRLANDLKAAAKAGEATAEREFTGLLDVYRKTWAAEGFVGLHRGFNISFVGIFVYRGLYFGLYDTVMPFLPADSSFYVRFGVGYVVTVLAGLASYPIDTIRRRMMMTAGGEAAHKYKNSLDCAHQIWAKEGFKSYFKGAAANILRGVAGAGVLSGFDTIKQAYVRHQYGDDAYA